MARERKITSPGGQVQTTPSMVGANIKSIEVKKVREPETSVSRRQFQPNSTMISGSSVINMHAPVDKFNKTATSEEFMTVGAKSLTNITRNDKNGINTSQIMGMEKDGSWELSSAINNKVQFPGTVT